MHLGTALSQDASLFSSFSTLTLLDLSYNDFSGAVPPLQQLTSLQTLQLQGNQFTGPLPQLAGFNSLTVANFQQNQLTGIFCVNVIALHAASGLCLHKFCLRALCIMSH